MLYEVERIKNRRFPTDEVVRRPMYAGRVYKTRGSLTDGHTHKAEMALVNKKGSNNELCICYRETRGMQS